MHVMYQSLTAVCFFPYVLPRCSGKTTVARLMVELFVSIGLLNSSEVLERSPSDLSTGFVGQAATATMKVLREARGRVLLIDEAYQLASGPGGLSWGNNPRTSW